MSNGEIKLEKSAVDFLKEEVGGGSTYTSGNGIEITNENVINADTKVVVYNGDLSELPNDILVSLNIGDALNVNDNYYFLSYKNQWGIRITSVDQNMVRTYFYSKNGEYYKYDHLEEKHFPVYTDPAFLSSDEGEIDWEIYDQIEYFHYCETNYGMAISIGWDEEKDTPKLSTVVQDNRYFTVSFTFNEPESEEEEGSVSYVITEHTLGGGIEFVSIDIDATRINDETLNKLVDFNNNTLKPNFIVLTTENETDTFPILMPSDNLQYIYRSAVMNDEYYQLTLSVNEEGADVSIQEVSVGGDGGDSDVLVLSLGDYVSDPSAELEPYQWDNVTVDTAMENGKVVFITNNRYRAWVTEMLTVGQNYQVSMQGAVTDGSSVGIGWKDNSQHFYFNSGPK